jgi:hypothetical protein
MKITGCNKQKKAGPFLTLRLAFFQNFYDILWSVQCILLDLFPDKDRRSELAIQSSKGRLRFYDHSFSLEIDESH